MAKVLSPEGFAPMTLNFSQFVFVFVAFAMASSGVLSAQTKPHFVIDPGHGGRDPGTQQNGLDEKDLTLDLAKRIKKILEERNFSTTLTRESDVYVGLVERAEIANKIPNAIFVSIHFNSHSNRTVQGIETFYWPGSEKSQRLASYLQGEMIRRVVTKDRGFKPGQLKVLEATKGPAALVECGFISNRWEAQRCQSSWFKQVLAEEITQALIRYSCPPKRIESATVAKQPTPIPAVTTEKKAPAKIKTVPIEPIYPVSGDN